jgi:cyanate permease
LTVFFGLALILAPVLAGFIADRTGSFANSFMAAVATGVLATLFFSRVRKPE